MAQNNIKVSVGALFPNGKFGEYRDGNFSLTNGQKYGGAGTGVGLGFSYKYGISGIKGLGIVASANEMLNPLNGDANDYLDNQELATNSEITRPKYLNFPLLIGGNYAYPLSEDVSIFAEAQIGINIRYITSMTKESGVAETTNTYTTATTMAYQLGAGLELKKKYSISVEYYNLGAGKMKGKITPGNQSLSGAKLTPTILALRLGYMF